MQVYELMSSVKGLDYGLYISMAAALNAVEKAAQAQGCFYKILMQNGSVCRTTIIDCCGMPQQLDENTFQDAVIRRKEIIEE